MDISKSSGPDLIPPELPDSELLGAWRYSYQLLDVRALPDTQRRAIHWTLAIDEAFTTEALWRDIPGYKFASCGFADPDFEADEFGVIVYVEMRFDDQSLREPISQLSVGNRSFPVFLRSAIEVLHGPPAHPMYGTTACWARSGKAGLEGRDGLLTAKHVVQGGPGSVGVGAQIPLIDTSDSQNQETLIGTLLDLGPEGIDAALIEPPPTLPRGQLRQLDCPQFIAQWTDVSFEGTRSAVHTKVVEVQLGRGSLHPSIPLRVFLAHPGQPGDSGALVIDNQGRGVGIYMLGLANLAGHMEGCCQHLAQVAEVMNLTPML